MRIILFHNLRNMSRTIRGKVKDIRSRSFVFKRKWYGASQLIVKQKQRFKGLNVMRSTNGGKNSENFARPKIVH